MFTLDLCESVAYKMMDPIHVSKTVQDSIDKQQFCSSIWDFNTLIDGFGGIACFYAFLDSVSPNKGWKKVAYEYLQNAVNVFNFDGLTSYSLFSGLAGLCFSIYFCSQYGNDYKNIQQKLDALLVNQVEKKLNKLKSSNDFLPSDYSLISGMAGILAYAIQRQSESHFRYLALEIAKWLSDSLSMTKEDNLVPWYVAPEHFFSDEEKLRYSKGVYWLNMPNGIIGCLSALALASKEQLPIKNLNSTIYKVACWVKDQQVMSEYGPSFPNTLSVEIRNTSSAYEINRDCWWSGVPAVARSIYLAASAIKDEFLKRYAENLFVSVFSKPQKEWNLMGTSFAHGRAGLLTLTYRMAQETHNPIIWKQVDLLEQDLKSFYRPNAPFGFQMVHVREGGEYTWVDHPGIWTGASGVALSLLLVQRQKDLMWDRAFLTA